jgi:hypothetical protein
MTRLRSRIRAAWARQAATAWQANDELVLTDEPGWIALRRSGFIILSAFVIRALPFSQHPRLDFAFFNTMVAEC